MAIPGTTSLRGTADREFTVFSNLTERKIEESQVALEVPKDPCATLPSTGIAPPSLFADQLAAQVASFPVGKCVIDLQKVEQIKTLLPQNPYVLEKEQVQKIIHKTGLTTDELLQHLVPIASEFALPPTSNYHVGAAGLAKDGRIFLGHNLEIPGGPLNLTVHGEQFLCINARYNKAKLLKIALSAEPCGYCRQSLLEIGAKKDQTIKLLILTPNSSPQELTDLLPKPFGPQDLGREGGLLSKWEDFPKSTHSDPLVRAALDGLQSSYAPYTCPHGVAIKTSSGKIIAGGYLENVAYNPSLWAIQSALALLIADKLKYEDISEVLLVEQKEGKIHHSDFTELLLKRVAPHAKYLVRYVDKEGKLIE
jgi:cytidine deaminase